MAMDYYRYNHRSKVAISPESKDFAQCGFVVYMYGKEKTFNTISAYGALLDQYIITVAPGESALLDLDKTTSVNKFPLKISASSYSLSEKQAANSAGDTGFSDIITTQAGETYRVLTNNSSYAQTYYVSVGTSLRKYGISLRDANKALNLVNQIKTIPWGSLLDGAVTLPEDVDMVKWVCQRNSTVNGMVKNAKSILGENPLVTYKLNISRLDDFEAPVFITNPVLNLKGGTITIKCLATDNFYLGGYQVSIFSDDDRLIFSGESKLSTFFIDTLAEGNYRAEVTAFDYLKRNKISENCEFTIYRDGDSGFKKGFNGNVSKSSKFEKVGEFTLDSEQIIRWNDVMATNTNGTLTFRITDAKNRVKATGNYTNGQWSMQTDFKLASGSYSLMLKSNTTSQYALAVESLDIGYSPENDSIKTACEVEFMEGFSNITGYVGYGNAVDFYHLKLDCNGALSVDVSEMRGKIKFELYNSEQKKISSKTVSGAGRVVFDSRLIEQSAYLAVISNDKGKGKYNSDYKLDFSTEIFPDSEGDSLNSPQGELIFGSDKQSGWVGFGDSQDVYLVNISDNGKYQLSISDVTEKLQLTIYTVKENQKFSKLKSVSVSAKSGTAIIDNLLLKPETSYVVAVNNSQAKKGKNSYYSLCLGGTAFNHPQNNQKNNFWNDDEVGSIDLNNGVKDEWVGFGDSVDYFKFSLVENSGCTLSLNVQESKAAKLTLYAVDEIKNKLKKVKLNKSGYADLCSGEYVVEVLSADKGKGKYNTSYDVSIALKA